MSGLLCVGWFRKKVVGNDLKRCPADAKLGVVLALDLLKDFPRLVAGKVWSHFLHVLDAPNHANHAVFGQEFAGVNWIAARGSCNVILVGHGFVPFVG